MDQPHCPPSSTLLSPHTHRLLKLLASTEEHAAQATSLLTLTAQKTSSSTIVWELIGKIKEHYLLSNRWQTRTNASKAIYSLACLVPPPYSYWEKSDSTTEHCLEVLQNHLPVLVRNGTLLLAHNSHPTTHVEPLSSQQQQQSILEKTLGLAGISQLVWTGTDTSSTNDTILMDDLMEQQPQKSSATTTTTYSQPCNKKQRLLDCPELDSVVSSSLLHFHVFHSNWQMRHGALLGYLALVKAWPEWNSSTWSPTVLCHSILVLGLDRFGDFTQAVVAPVREVAGQVVAALWNRAPEHVQHTILTIMETMTAVEQDWEVRHGALVATKYILVVAVQQQTTSRRETIVRLLELAKKHVLDDSDDVKSVAAQVLCEAVRRDASTVQLMGDIVVSLWMALQKARSVSSCLVDLVELLTVLMERDCATVIHRLQTAELGTTAIDFLDVANLLNGFLRAEFVSVQRSAIQCVCSLAQPMALAAERGSRAAVSAHSCLAECCFDMFLTPYWNECVQSPNFADTSNLFQQISLAWNALASLPAFRSFDNERSQLELKLICRYFGIHSSRSRQIEEFGVYVEASRALAVLFKAKGESALLSPVLRLALRSFLKSPWAFQCEAACLLIRSLASGSTKAKISEEFAVILHALLTKERPICIRLGSMAPKFDSALDDEALARVCDEAFLRRAAHLMDESSIEHASDDVVDLWLNTFRVKGIALLPAVSNTSANVLSMRVDATIAGAIVVSSLPLKLTPLIRCLMTSLKNETASSESAGIPSDAFGFLWSTRLGQTCIYMSDLLKATFGSEQFTGARQKVMENLCDLAVDESVSRPTHPGPGGRVLQLLTASLAPDQSLQDIPSLWNRLQLLLSDGLDDTDDEAVLQSIKLLTIAGRGLIDSEKAMVSGEMDRFIDPMIRVACRRQDVILQDAAKAVLLLMCSADQSRVLNSALMSVSVYLRDKRSDSRRKAACELLESLVQGAGVNISVYVRTLLPIVMTLMTDPIEACARSATKTFSVLVRIAPLVRRNESVRLGMNCDERQESVIDHLIFGKPLPPSTLPRVLKDAFAASGIELRGYQKEGIAWLHFLQSVNLSGALCDSMGLGKTLQALVAITLSSADSNGILDPSKISLIVCPSSVVGHWIAEIKKFFPNGEVFCSMCFIGSSAERKVLWQTRASSINMVVTSYSVMRSDIDLLSSVDWHFCVLDEGHLLKNPKTATARASRQIKAQHKLILTGTPIQNRVNELWATFDFLMPNFLGTHASFSKEFAVPIAKSHLPGATPTAISDGLNKLKALHQQVLPFILRREKEQVLEELPPKIVSTISVSMSDVQAQIYRSLSKAKALEGSLSFLQAAMEKKVGERVALNADALKSLLVLRLVCTHPALLAPTGHMSEQLAKAAASGKLCALLDLLRDAGIYDDSMMAADNDSSLLYCTENDDDNNSATFDSVVESAEGGGMYLDLDRVASKCIIFAQFAKSLDIVEKFVFQQCMPSVRYVRLDGKVAAKERAEVAQTFNEDPELKVLLATTRVGGLGLNLTGADIVIFLENDFNPFVDLQAQDRAHRIGQKKTVNVYNLVTKDSIEERIMEIQHKKVGVAKAIVNSENSSLYSMGTDRLLDIFAPTNNDDDASNSVLLDLDALVEQYTEDYKSLSVEEFLRNFE